MCLRVCSVIVCVCVCHCSECVKQGGERVKVCVSGRLSLMCVCVCVCRCCCRVCESGLESVCVLYLCVCVCVSVTADDGWAGRTEQGTMNEVTDGDG